MKTQNILVLGNTGMLGQQVYKTLSKKESLNVRGTNRISGDDSSSEFKFYAEVDIQYQLDKITKKFMPDFIINCVGVIKNHIDDKNPNHVENAIMVNALYPHILADYFEKKNSSTKIIQIATDCVYTGETGPYKESCLHDAKDVYGKTKSLGEVNRNNVYNIRTSIIGLEIKGKTSLLEWFLSNKDGDEVYGFENHLWNGVSTIQFADLCLDIISGNFRKKFGDIQNFNYVINEDINKSELLKLINKTFKRNIKIKPTSTFTEDVDRRLRSEIFTMKNKFKMSEVINEIYLKRND